MGSNAINLPPLPPGFKLDGSGAPPPPPGFVLDQPATQPERPGFLRRAYESSLKPIVDFASAVPGAIAESPLTLGGGPMRRKFVDEPQVEQFSRAREDFRTGHPVRGAVRGAIASIPLLGPGALGLAESVGEDVSTGNLRGLAGTATGLAATALAPKGVRLAGPRLSAAASRVGETGIRASEGLAESGLGLRWSEKMHGKTPGYGVLAETEGGPRQIAGPPESPGSARSRLAAIDDASVSEFEAAKARGETASTDGPLRVIDEEIAAAERGQHPELVEALKKQRERLTIDTATNEPLPANLDPLRYWEIKRHWGDGTEWNKINPRMRGRIERGVYRAMDAELDRIAPRTAELNQRASSLIAVRNRADITAEGPSVLTGVFNRGGARTGALLSAAGGYAAGGIPGGIAGLVLPEVLPHPSTRIAAARGLYRLSGGRKLPAPELLPPTEPPGFSPRGLLPGMGETTPAGFYATQVPRRGAQRLLPSGEQGAPARETVQPRFHRPGTEPTEDLIGGSSLERGAGPAQQSRLRPVLATAGPSTPNIRESFRVPRINAGGITQTELPAAPSGRPSRMTPAEVETRIENLQTARRDVRNLSNLQERMRRLTAGEAERRRVDSRSAFMGWLEEKMGVSQDLWEQMPDGIRDRLRREFVGRE